MRRCQKVTWLIDLDAETTFPAESPTSESNPTSPTSPAQLEDLPPALPAPRKLTKRNSNKLSGLSATHYLTPQLQSARSSTLSILEIAGQREKPGIITPSRKDMAPISAAKKERPALPQARRSAWARMKGERRPEISTEPLHDKKQGEDQETDNGTETEVYESPVDRVPAESVLDAETATVSAVQVSLPAKKPPPAPKTRRWRGKQTQEEGGGGALRNVHFRSIPTNVASAASSIDSFSPSSPKTLSGAEVGAPKESVSTALGEAQAEAISSIGDVLDKTTLGPEPQGEGSPTIILAPPSSAPPRSVPGPRFNLERSPFLADDDEEDE